MLHVSSVFCLLFSRFQIVSGLSGYSSDPQFSLIKLLLLKNSFLWGVQAVQFQVMTVGPNKLEMDIRNVVVFPQGPG